MKPWILIIGMWFLTDWAYATELKVDVKGAPADIAKIMKVIPGVQKVLNSPEFKLKVLAAKYTTTKDSPEIIYNKIMIPTWNLFYQLQLKKSWNGRCPVLGWTYPSTKVVWFNSCNFRGRSETGLAGTICHEQMHKLGYDHKTAKDSQSVPYSIGNICSELYGKIK
jgi:hypothetical protein